jgi:hypothetical protein
MTDRCLICGRKLRDAESVARRIGSTCFRRLQKLTNEEKAKKRHRREQLKKSAVEKNQVTVFEILETNL